MTFDQIKGEPGNHDPQPDNKLSRIDTKPEGPILGIFSRNPAQEPELTSTGKFEKHVSLLIVDDEAPTLKVLTRLFSGSASFETANSLQSALAAAERMEGCRVLITDFNLSKTETSVPLIKRTKELFPNAKVIVLSGNIEDAKEAVLGAGMDAVFFQKPFSMSELKDLVDSYLK